MEPTEQLNDYRGSHTTWCTNRGAEFPAHTQDEPYCSKLVHSIALIPDEGFVKANVWVAPTSAFTRGQFTSAEHAERERRYTGIELAVEAWQGPDGSWNEKERCGASATTVRRTRSSPAENGDVVDETAIGVHVRLRRDRGLTATHPAARQLQHRQYRHQCQPTRHPGTSDRDSPARGRGRTRRLARRPVATEAQFNQKTHLVLSRHSQWSAILSRPQLRRKYRGHEMKPAAALKAIVLGVAMSGLPIMPLMGAGAAPTLSGTDSATAYTASAPGGGTRSDNSPGSAGGLS